MVISGPFFVLEKCSLLTRVRPGLLVNERYGDVTPIDARTRRCKYPGNVRSTHCGTSHFMMNRLSIASLGLFIGAIGLGAFYGYLFPHLPTWIVTGISLLPCLMVFVISFCKVAPFGPRPFRYCLVFATCWYTVATLLAEVLYLLTRPAASKHFRLLWREFLRILACSVSSSSFVSYSLCVGTRAKTIT